MYERLRMRLERARSAGSMEQMLAVVDAVLAAIGSAGEADADGLVRIDVSEARERAERFGLGEMPIFKALE